MMKLFEQYKNSGKITEALLVGRNLFNRYPSNREVFNSYFDFLLFLAENLPSLSEKKDFAGQAGTALAFFSENAEVDAEVVNSISEHQQRLASVYSVIQAQKQEEQEKYNSAVNSENNSCLKQLISLKDKLHLANSQTEFDAILLEVGKIDTKIDKSAFDEKQAALYDRLTKEHTGLISDKMHELEYRKNTEYNKKAAEAYSEAFKHFNADEYRYKNQTQLFELASKSLFAYDASRLFNETLIYYNHVYTYIFSKLDDDGKFNLTRFSIECEKKLR
jgi:hypothetical protein